MISLHHLSDPWEIKRLLTKDSIYKEVYFTTDLYSEQVIKSNQLWFKIILDSTNEELGILLVKELSNKCVCPHGGIFKEFRHKYSLKIVQEILDFLIKLHLQPILTILSSNIPMIKIVNKLGYNKHLIIKNGSPLGDLLIFGEKE